VRGDHARIALNILRSLAREFPGLVDGETDVNGADLTDALTDAIKEAEIPLEGQN